MMDIRRDHFLQVVAGAVLSPFLSRRAHAQSYPNRPVRLIVASAAGGPPDTIMRIVAQKLSEILGQPFVIENIPTGAGNVGAAAAARAIPDGYTLLAPTSSIVVNPSLYAKLAFDPLRDFDPVTLVAVSPHVLVVHPSFPAISVGELLVLLKDNPGKYSYASPGTGTTGELAAELFKHGLGVDLVRIPFNGGAPAMTATIGNHTQLAFVAVPSAAAAIKDGRVRALALTSSRRIPDFPEMPTMAEVGLANQESYFWQCLLVPHGTPTEVTSLLHHTIARVLALPEIKQRLAAIGFEPVANSPALFAAQFKAEVERWAHVINAANIKKID